GVFFATSAAALPTRDLISFSPSWSASSQSPWFAAISSPSAEAKTGVPLLSSGGTVDESSAAWRRFHGGAMRDRLLRVSYSGSRPPPRSLGRCALSRTCRVNSERQARADR